MRTYGLLSWSERVDGLQEVRVHILQFFCFLKKVLYKYFIETNHHKLIFALAHRHFLCELQVSNHYVDQLLVRRYISYYYLL